MSRGPEEETTARRAALGGAAVGLLIAAALLLPALLSGGVPARGDLADFFWPMKAYTAERWGQGSVPLWNPLSGCGEPWLAQLQSGALYPGDLPFLIGWREGAFLGIALHLALAAAGAAFWLWELGGSRPAALLAGGLYAGGGAFLSLVPVYNNASTAAWLPWIFAGAWRVAAGRSRGAGLAIAAAGAFLAGEPALAAAGCAAALALSLVARADGEPAAEIETRGRLAARLALPLLVGTAIAGAALLPFASYVGTSGRRGNVTREEAVARPVGASDLADLVAAPRAEATRTEAPGRGGYLVALSLGPLPLLLVAGAGAGLPGRRKLLGGLALLAAAALLLSLGPSGLLAPLLYDAGLLRGLRYPARWFVFVHLVLALAAGAGLDGWLWGRFGRENAASGAGAGEEEEETRERASRSRAARLALAGGLLLFGALLAVALLHPAARASRDARLAAVGGAAAVLGALLVAFARTRAAGPPTGMPLAVAALALVPLPFFGAEPLAAVPAAVVRAAPGALPSARGPEAGRVFAPAGLDRNLAARWRYADGAAWSAAGVSRASEALAGYSNLFHDVAMTGSASPLGNPRVERLVGAALAGGAADRILALLNVRHVLSPFPPRLPGLRLAREANGVGRYDAPGAFGRAWFPGQSRFATDEEAFEALRGADFDPGEIALVAPDESGGPLPPRRPKGSWAAARVLSDEPERVELATSASAPSLLVLTRSWDPGWEARLDGTPVPIRRAQLAFLAVVAPVGEHRLELLYRPLSFRIGLGVSAAGLVGLLALSFAGPPGKRHR